jgi:hypothetical protein
VEVHVVVVNIHVETLEEPFTPKPTPIIIPKIGVGAMVTLIDSITHVVEVFRTPYIVLKDTPVTKRSKSQPIPLAEPFDTIGE